MAIGRITLKYMFQYPVKVELDLYPSGEMGLCCITPQDPDEFELVLGKDGNGFGQLGCWDAGAVIQNESIYLYGNDGPHGGNDTGKNVELVIQLCLAQVKINVVNPIDLFA